MTGLSASLSVGVFAKYPEPGRVKTRLIPLLGAHGAAEFARFLLLRALHSLLATPVQGEGLADQGGRPAVWLWRSGGTEAQWQHLLAPVIQASGRAIEPAWQIDQHLGARMAHALEAQLGHSPQAMLLGTDAIQFTVSHCHEVARSLSEYSLAYVPAHDGGYVAVGCSRKVPAVFGAAIDWGSEQVLEQSLEAAARGDVPVVCLGPQLDVDEPADFEQALAAGWIPADWQKQFPHPETGSENK